MSLFDPAPYTDERKVRAPRRKPDKLPMLKLRWPWALTRTVKKEPVAHLIFNTYTDRDKSPMVIPECNQKEAFNVLPVDGEPVVDVCRQCLTIAKRRKLPMELRERPE